MRCSCELSQTKCCCTESQTGTEAPLYITELKEVTTSKSEQKKESEDGRVCPHVSRKPERASFVVAVVTGGTAKHHNSAFASLSRKRAVPLCPGGASKSSAWCRLHLPFSSTDLSEEDGATTACTSSSYQSIVLDRCRRSPRRQMLRPQSFVQAWSQLWACAACVAHVSTRQVRKKSKQATPKLRWQEHAACRSHVWRDA